MSFCRSTERIVCLPPQREAAVAWARKEAGRWVEVAKPPLAALLAMLIAMLLNLDQPRTAMVSVFVVMQPETGMVLAKSLYRIAGTIAGTLVSLLLVGTLSQQPELFLLGLALWVGVCTAGAAFYRNNQSYAFVLAGYTAAIIGLPAAVLPTTFFSVATTRLTELTLGIMCAGIVCDIFFPRRVSDSIAKNVRNRYIDFVALVKGSLSGALSGEKLEEMQLNLVRDVISLEWIRSAAIWEDPEVRARDSRLRNLNREFMAASATFHSFYRLRNRLSGRRGRAGQALDSLYQAVDGTLEEMGDIPRASEDAVRAARSIAVFRARLTRDLARVRSSAGLENDPQAQLDFETAVELLYRFLGELHAYTRTYAGLVDRRHSSEPTGPHLFAFHTDPLLALVAGGRAALGTVVAGAFWILTAWPYGISVVINVAVVTALCSSYPDPPKAIRQMTVGFSGGFLAALLFKFMVLPELDGVLMLMVCMLPFLLVGSLLVSGKKYAGVGAGFLIFFTVMTAPGNPMQFDPVDTVNEGSATVIGVAVAGILLRTLIPVDSGWYRRRLVRLLRRQVVLACSCALAGAAHSFESVTHDLLHTLSITRQGGARQDPLDLAWIFPSLEMGRAVLRLRKDAGACALPPALQTRLAAGIQAVGGLFGSPSATTWESALSAVSGAIMALGGQEPDDETGSLPPWFTRRLLISLHLVRTVLLEEEMALACTSADTILGGPFDAA